MCRPNFTVALDVAYSRKRLTEQYYPSPLAGVSSIAIVRPEAIPGRKGRLHIQELIISAQETPFHGVVLRAN